MSALEKKATLATVEEYLEGERKSETRHEYVAGDVYAMAGASRTHNIISLNIANALRGLLRGKRWQAFITDMKVRVRTRGETLFYYPDVFVSCDPRDTDDYFSDYPTIIFEVLSPDTARLDQREKRWAYQTLESLQTYVLVDQFKRELHVWRRVGENWETETLAGTEAVLSIAEPAIELPLSEFYADTGV